MSISSGRSRFSFAQIGNAGLIEDMYSQFLADPDSVDPSWQYFFAGFDFAVKGDGPSSAPTGGSEEACLEALVNAYRRLGHLSAKLDPLSDVPKRVDDLDPAKHGLGSADRNKKFQPVNFHIDGGEGTLDEIFKQLETTYCSTLGADYREINDIESILWLQEKMETCKNAPVFDAKIKKRIFDKLTAAEGFEKFLQDRFLGQKRFSIEGLDAMIPMLDMLADEGSKLGVKEIDIGMAHRGRLNVLANFMGKEYGVLLSEFEGAESKEFTNIEGDVKYHKGFTNIIDTVSGGKMSVFLCPNPSHLEAVNPVLEGFTRSRQRQLGLEKAGEILPVLIHGDAAVVGQGVVTETLNFMNLEGYTTSGTIHIIANNLIGFTANPDESKSCDYASDVAKAIRAPVLHVNADDPEKVVWAAQLAMQYRQKFSRDIVLDIMGYRRHGHNETDEPAFTQPLLYAKVKKHPTVWNIYSQQLDAEKQMTVDDSKASMKSFRSNLQETLNAIREKKWKSKHKTPKGFLEVEAYREVSKDEMEKTVKTAVAQKSLLATKDSILNFPKSFTPHPKISKLFGQREKMFEGEGSIDWGMAELLAYGSSAADGYHVRLTGQDTRRGTFSHRHAVLRDSKTGASYEALNQIGSKQGHVDVINSPLSEAACLGFEFGYSVADPSALVLWEAQFGDFVNGAQIIIDQFLVASEAKWKQTTSLVMLLPHGYEGQGPEHSSARPERFLQSCGNLNIQVANLTTPAQLFHILRRQVVRDFQKPLIIFSPKSLLRHPKVVSPIKEFTSGEFHHVLDDSVAKKSSVKRIVMCSGKIFYELLEKQESDPKFSQTTALVRVEQLYPFPKTAIENIVNTYKKADEIYWVQEEPVNMGAWFFMRARLEELCGDSKKLKYVGRRGSGSTAEGSMVAHKKEQARIISESFE